MNAIEDLADVPSIQVSHDWLSLAFGVNAQELTGGCFSFWPGARGILLVVQPLPLQIVQLDIITIHQHQTPNACTQEGPRLKTPKSSTTDNRDTRIEQPLLPGKANSGKANLARVAVPITLVHSFPFPGPIRWTQPTSLSQSHSICRRYPGFGGRPDGRWQESGECHCDSAHRRATRSFLALYREWVPGVCCQAGILPTPGLVQVWISAS